MKYKGIGWDGATMWSEDKEQFTQLVLKYLDQWTNPGDTVLWKKDFSEARVFTEELEFTDAVVHVQIH